MSVRPIQHGAATVTAPNAMRQPAVVHLDLDGARHIFRLRGWAWNETRDPVYESGLPAALDVFAQEKITATLFVIAEDLEDPAKRDLLAEAVRRGHTIASHSVTHRKLAELSSEEKRREIFDSRDRIGNVLGTLPDGFRAPAFSIDRESLVLLEEAGYSYDSSVLPGRPIPNTTLGSQAQPAAALHDGTLVELPLPSYKPLPVPFHPSYSLVLGGWYFRLGLSRFRAAAAPMVMLFHLIDFSDPLPSRLLSSAGRRLFTLSHVSGSAKRNACRAMLGRIRRDFTLVTTEQLLEGVKPEGLS